MVQASTIQNACTKYLYPDRSNIGTKPGQVKRYTLAMPEELYESIKGLAEAHDTTLGDCIKKNLRLGMTIACLASSKNVKVIIQEEGKEPEVLLPVF
jgi:hypothetical protein